ncbi:MAG: hypothetical protein AB7Q01_09190 [Gammaproteobacteria bacterium]
MRCTPETPSGAALKFALASAAAWLILVALAGCAASRLESGHPLISGGPDEETAHVYFIRPRTERYLGVADNALTIEADRSPLLELAKGEYALVALKPGSVWLTVRSDTSWGPAHDIKEMSTTREFTFTAGQTYFVALTAVDGEFRGVTYHADAIDLDQARQLSANLRPAGASARATPISIL